MSTTENLYRQIYAIAPKAFPAGVSFKCYPTETPGMPRARAWTAVLEWTIYDALKCCEVPDLLEGEGESLDAALDGLLQALEVIAEDREVA